MRFDEVLTVFSILCSFRKNSDVCKIATVYNKLACWIAPLLFFHGEMLSGHFNPSFINILRINLFHDAIAMLSEKRLFSHILI